MPMFNWIFSSLYYKMPKDIQPPEATTRLCYATSLHSYLNFLLIKRRYVTLQQMFDDAQEIEENFQACQKLPKDILDKNEDV